MADAPIFKAYWKKLEGKTILSMSRSSWNSMASSVVSEVDIDIESTPMGAVSKNTKVLNAKLEKYGPELGKISVFREDLEDYPKVVNKDTYIVWTDVSLNPLNETIFISVSTHNDDNFKQFCRENVFFVKQSNEDDHHMTLEQFKAIEFVRSS